MLERLQMILKEIDDGTITRVNRLEFSVLELLSKDSNGVTFLENLFKRNISLGYNMNKIIENNIDVAYIYCNCDKSLYSFEWNEDDLFSNINGQTYLEYFISKDKLNSKMISVIDNHFEIIDILMKCNKTYYLEYLNSNIINKLISKNQDGSYEIEKYMSDENVLGRLIPLINDPDVLLELSLKYDNYEMLKKVNEDVLMSKTPDGQTFLHYLINDMNMIPDKLNRIPNKEEFVKFLFNNNLYDYLAKATESTMLIEIEPGKTLLEFLIEMGYDSKIDLSIYDKKTLNILDNNNKLELAGDVNEYLLKKPANEVLEFADSFEDVTLLEYMLDRGYNPLEKRFYISDDNIIKILYERQRPDLLIKADQSKLLNGIYFEYILENIKTNRVKISLRKLFPSGKDVDKIVEYYMSIAKYDMMDYVNKLEQDDLLKEYNGVTLLDRLLEVDRDMTLDKILSKSVKSKPQIAAILKSKGIELQGINVSSKEGSFADDYLKGVQNTLGIGPLPLEAEELLNELEQLFLSDGKSDKDLVAALVSGYRHSLFVNYGLHINEIKTLISVKKNNLDKFYYHKIDDGAYFSPMNGSVYCDSLVVETLLHESGHALHYYLTESRVPDNYHEIIFNVRTNPETLGKIEEYANSYHKIKQNIYLLVEQKYQSFFESYYSDDKRNEINEFLNQEKLAKMEEFKKLGISDEQLDIILNGMFTEEEFIEHQKRIFINENVDAVLRSEFGAFMAIGDILDAIYEGSLHSGALKNQHGENVKRTCGHGIAYYYDTIHGFDEMVANFAFISKSKDAVEKLQLLKSIVGDDLYNMLSEFYYQNISYGKNEQLETGKSMGGK